MILCIFDLETTGLDRTKDSIIQFAGMKIDTDSNKIIGELNLYIRPCGNFTINPGAYFKHHIDAKFLDDKPTMPKTASKIVEFFDDVTDVLTYNGNGFDIPFLKFELNKYGFDIDFSKMNCYDAFLEEKRRNGINLENTYKRYKGKTMEEAGLNAHDAFSDIKATYTVFVAQQKQKKYGPEVVYGEDGIVTDMPFVYTIINETTGEKSYEERTVPCFAVGKYRQVAVDQVAIMDQNYIRWCVTDSKFMPSTKKFLQKYLR